MAIAIVLLKATALLLIALGATVLMQRASAGARHLVWLVAFGALLALPPLAAWGPLRLRVLPSAAVSLPGETPAGTVLDVSRADAAGRVAHESNRAGGSPVISGATAPAPITSRAQHLLAEYPPALWLFGLWGVVALSLLAWLVRGAWQVRRIVGRASPLNDPAWQVPLYEIADRLELDAAPILLRSEDVKMPFACGLVHCIIVLPAESDHWSAERRSAVLIHELGHVRRRDLIGHTAGRIACAVYWFHPLVWTAARRLRAESERACDDLALVFGARASDYAEHLLDIVTYVRHHATPATALAMAHRKEFEGRMLAILDPGLSRRAPTRRETTIMATTLMILALVVCAAAPVPRAAAPAPLTRVPATPVAPPGLPHDTPHQTELAGTGRRNGRTDKPARTNAVAGAAGPNAAVEALAAPGDSSHRAALLIDVLQHDSAAEVRRTAAWGLQHYDDQPSVAVALTAALAHDADPEVREMSAWALESFGNPASSVALAVAARDDASEAVRETAVWALGSRNVHDAAPQIESALAHDNDATVRSTAAWALGQLDLTGAPPALLTALGDSNESVRYTATWATLQIGDSLALPALRAALRKESSERVQQAMLRALIHSGEDPERMVEWLRSPNTALRQTAVEALSGGRGDDPWPWPWPRPRPFSGQ